MGLTKTPTYTQFVAPESGACGTFPVARRLPGSRARPVLGLLEPGGGTNSLASDHLQLAVPSGRPHDCWNASAELRARAPARPEQRRGLRDEDRRSQPDEPPTRTTGSCSSRTRRTTSGSSSGTAGPERYVRAYKVINGSGVLPPSITTASPISLGATNYLRVTRTGNDLHPGVFDERHLLHDRRVPDPGRDSRSTRPACS